MKFQAGFADPALFFGNPLAGLKGKNQKFKADLIFVS